MNIKKVVLLAGDIIIYYIALFLTLIIRYQALPDRERILQHLVPFTIILLLWLAVFIAIDLYSLSFSRNTLEFFKPFLSASLLNLFIAFTFFYIMRLSITPRANMFLVFGIFSMLQYGWRKVVMHTLATDAFQNNVLGIGTNPELEALIRFLEDKPQLGYRFAQVLDTTFFTNSNLTTSLADIIRTEHITTIVITQPKNTNTQFEQALFHALQNEITIFTFPHFFEIVTGKIPVRSITYQWFFENLTRTHDRLYHSTKRLMDIVITSIAGIIILPFLPLIALAIVVDDPGPILFTQIRSGKNGKPFLGIKFRSMRINAEQHGPQWSQKNDPRVTRFGRFLRRSRIDEIPQFINILKGEMSLVGPRPERPEFIEKLTHTIPFYNERHLVTPGLTGWAQINFPYGASEHDALEKLQYDLYYIKNKSLILDAAIMLKTIKAILLGGGSEGAGTPIHSDITNTL